MLKRWMHKRERYFAMLNDNRTVRPFEWGTEFIHDNPNGDDPLKLFRQHSAEVIANSEDYLHLTEKINYELRITNHQSEEKTGTQNPKIGTQLLSWESAVKTPSAENNTAFARFFKNENDKKAAVVVLPHWNAQAGSYFDLCKFFNRVGVSALRLTLPYHEERMPPELERADFVVSPNVGRTIQSIRQSTLDTKAAVKWLYEQGYENVCVVGTSIGSCVAFLAFTHDPTIRSVVFNHVSGYVADVAWRGLSTYHVREGLEGNISLDDLRMCWAPVSPMNYIEKMAGLPERPQRYIYTLYDLSFPIDLSLDTMEALEKHDIKHSKVSIPCGHYTLGEKPWVYLDGYKIISFLRKNLR
jgi:hypothetical protein